MFVSLLDEEEGNFTSNFPPPPLLRQSLVGQGIPTFESSPSHSDTLDTRVFSSPQKPLPDNTNNTHKRQTSEFKSTIPARERPQIQASDRGATGNGLTHQ